MLHTMGHFLKAIVILAIMQCSLSVQPNKAAGGMTTTMPPTTPHPVTTKLEQLKKMEESALQGWYDLVTKFLAMIKPDQRTIDYVVDIVNGKVPLIPKEIIITVAKMNYAFLAMVVIGIIYAVVMLITGILFLICRCLFGRCGAKSSQRQRRNDNWWRTVHKFCLILVIAFLVVPTTCICIINEHMKHSAPQLKGNVSEIFDILLKFANDTDEDIDSMSQKQLVKPLENFDSFKDHFVELVHDNISNSVDHEKLEEIKNIVTWILTVEDQHDSIVNASTLSKAVKDLKSRIKSIRQQTESLHNCSDLHKKICQLDLEQLPLESMNVDEAYVHVQSEFQKLLKINFEELKNVIDKIQNSTVLRNKIEEESESLKNFATESLSGDLSSQVEMQQEMVQQMKAYVKMLRKFTETGQNTTVKMLPKFDEFQKYRWWVLFGIAVVLFIPIAFLTIGLLCGCCGYEKERHPTKRSSASNCGGICLILAVYYIFLVSSVLMVATIGIFVLGGSIQTFVCIPLFQENFEILDEYKEKLKPYANGTIFYDLVPSKFLQACQEDKSIVIAMGMMNDSDSSSFEKLLSNPAIANSLNTEEIDNKLKNSLLEITSSIRERLHQFTNALNLKDMKDIPQKLQESLKKSKENLSEFIKEVKVALKEDPNEDTINILMFVDESAANLFDVIDDFEKKLNNFSSPLLNISKEANNYKAKIRAIETSLDQVEEKLPKAIKYHLFQAAFSSSDFAKELQNVGKCYPVWVAFDFTRTAVCEFVVNPVNGFWFALGWALLFFLPAVFFSVKLSRYYLRMKYDDDMYIRDSGEAIPLEDINRTKPFSYTNPGAMSWMPQFPQNQYMVHPTSNQARKFYYK